MKGSIGVWFVTVVVFISIILLIVLGPGLFFSTAFGLFAIFLAIFLPVLAIYGAFRLLRFFVNIVMKAMGFQGDD